MAWDLRTMTVMVQQKRENDIIGRIARVAGFVLLVSLLFPAVRRTIAGFGFWGMALSLLAIIGLLGFGIYRLTTRITRKRELDENPFAPLTDKADPAWRREASEGTLELCRPALRRRYPWRH
jgi:hypothetical protein